ncbi:Na(+)/H(+) antiporter subunit D [Halobacterium sp. KA-6]|jgi:multicomponent Na+:H+ antiporter subunit D|uniref:Na(+)/H(+) antiporter subunit D n=1 Tax=Halobacterium sp. KA-6 TaxID=2896368 RepID=UPI001E329399|nr:Na(+)/H(+) antiporter subunit D [Halobacterium sp. KA-6]MCD2202305.1 Na(+)/H(+) antiporter subunit D [Halobacterium sp. KA-6]
MDAIVPPFVPVLLAAILLPFLGRRVGHALGALASAAVVPYVWLVSDGVYFRTTLFGFDAVLFNVDPFSTLMGLIFGFIGAAAILYSYASDAENLQSAFALGYVGTSLGAVFGGDWLTLIFFWELMAVTSTLLVWHYGGRAVRAGFRYALAHGISGTLLLGAIVWHFAETGTFLFASVPGGPEAGGLAGPVAPVLGAIGIGVNVGFIGLHAWLPDTYPRPHVAASVFLCVFTTKTGVYGMYRVFPDDGSVAVAYMGGFMAVFGATMALFQNDMRRLLSYHIQSQVGYMVAGVGIGSALAQAGAFAHVFNHILYKGLLFMAAGVVVYRTGEENLKKLGGLAREMPLTAAAFTVAALSIAGFPGFNGFVSKGIVISASHYDFVKGPFSVAGYTSLEILLLIGGVGTFMSFIKFGYYAFFHGSYDGSVKDANRGQSVAMVTVAALCIVYGLAPDALFAVLPYDVTDPNVVSHAYHTYTTSHILEGVALAAAGLVGFVLVKKPLSKLGRVPDVDNAYNPLTFYATRYLAVGVTELYAAVDRAAVRTADATAAVVTAPGAAAGRLVGEDRVSLRADMSTSILLVVVMVAVALVLVL